MKIGGVASPELEGAQGLMGFSVQDLVSFHAQRKMGFCGKFRNWWLLFRLFT